MSGNGADADGASEAPPTMAPGGADQEKQKQQQQDLKEQMMNRSKKQAKKKGKSGGAMVQQEEVSVLEGQNDFVRVMKVESKKEASQEDPYKVQLSKIGKAAQLQLSEDRMSVSGLKGFRSVRASHGVHQGTWYCEVKITKLGKTGHARVGWCTKKAEMQAPVGFDQFGYCYRDLEGSKVHQGAREPYAEPFVEGDVIGMLVHLPEGGRPLETQDRNVVRYACC